MAYSEHLADRVRTLLRDRGDVDERTMFGGLTFMLGGHMCCGVHGDELIVRLHPDDEDAALARPRARAMDFTTRRMRGFVTVAPDGLRGQALRRWVAQAVAHAETQPPRTAARS
jgi:TfoX/Sxy family transcriptional regulator of competence genes